MKDIDIHTLKEAAAGNLDAFEAMMNHYEKLVYNIAYRMFYNSEDAKDVLQDVFIKVYKNIGACKDLERFKSWLCSITTNACIDELRKRKINETERLDDDRDLKHSVMANQLSLRIVADDKTPEDAVIDKESWQELQDAINALSDDERLLIVLRDIQGLAYNELADVLALNIGTVKSRLSRARYKLRNILLERKNSVLNND